MDISARGRLHTLFKHVWDGYARDELTGISVCHRHHRSPKDAKVHAVMSLLQELRDKGMLQDNENVVARQSPDDTPLLGLVPAELGALAMLFFG